MPPPWEETLDEELALLETLETDEELILEDEELKTELDELLELAFDELVEDDDETEDDLEEEDIKDDDLEEIMEELALLDKDEFARLDELDLLDVDDEPGVIDVAILLEDRVTVDELELDNGAWLEELRDDITTELLVLPLLFVSPEPAPQAAKLRVNIESQATR